MWHASARGARDDGSAAHPRALLPERDGSRALEDDEQFLLSCVAVGRIALCPGRNRHVAETGLEGADDVAEVEVDRTGVELPP
jgi:hypothetical protein